MTLIIVLIVFSIILLGIFVGFYIWWVKYGKKIFKMFTDLQKMGKSDNNIPNFTNLGEQMRLINDLLSKKLKK
jgi:hypothetical protein